jgi:hypothetical protein
MGRGTAFTASEDDFLAANGENKTAKELFYLHEQLRVDMLWPPRSIKSLARRVERLRELKRIDVRDEETRRKAYYGRNRLRGE